MPGEVVHAQTSQGGVQIEWLTWSFFRITSPRGKVILTNPWLTNPDSQSTVDVDGIRIRVVDALHGSGGKDEIYGGPALGFFVTFENGYTLYFSGSTDVTLDMRLWGALFKPDAAILYYSRAMADDDVAQMVRLLSEDNPALNTVILHHHRLNAPAQKSPGALAAAMKNLGLRTTLLDPVPGKVYTLSK